MLSTVLGKDTKDKGVHAHILVSLHGAAKGECAPRAPPDLIA